MSNPETQLISKQKSTNSSESPKKNSQESREVEIKTNPNEESDSICCNILCLFGCLSLCGCSNAITRKIVFFPPSPNPSTNKQVEPMSVTRPINNNKNIIGNSNDVMLDFTNNEVVTSEGNTLVTLYIKLPINTNNNNPKLTLLFSHGNAIDLGCLRAHLIDLAARINCDIFAYDYSGYGESTGSPSVSNLYADSEAALKFLTTHYDVPIDQIVLYGQSLGSAPTLYLGSKFPGFKGIITHSAFTSGLRVIRNLHHTFWFDIMPNIDYIAKIKDTPLLVIHGVADEEIPIHHGAMLWEKSNKIIEPFFVDDGGHNDIEMTFRGAYIDRLRVFIVEIESYWEAKKNNKESVLAMKEAKKERSEIELNTIS